ncbi:Uncharacterised protein [Mycobacteroides abscessus]|nr:Uncharacterised protein [Mycobacteroides abscessus]SKS26863.1 Uncharacterised protein [Mycobacteroides abscessus subsp. abscessus]
MLTSHVVKMAFASAWRCHIYHLFAIVTDNSKHWRMYAVWRDSLSHHSDSLRVHLP